MNPDANGWYRVHANDGTGLDYSTTVYDPERHDLVEAPAADEFGRPYPASATAQPVAEPVVDVEPEPVAEIPDPAELVAPGKRKSADKTSVNEAEEATK